jgi:hypothetical protein
MAKKQPRGIFNDAARQVRDRKAARAGKRPSTWQALRDGEAYAEPDAYTRSGDYQATEDDVLGGMRNARFGNDMAWLDELFQENPIDAYTAAQQLGTSADPAAQAAQRGAMDAMFGIANGGGATAMERARRQKARGESENWLFGQREADMQNLAERGMSGGGAEIAALLGDRQAAASRLSQADLDTDAALEQRALDALMSGEQIAGGINRDSNAFIQGNADMISRSAARNKQFMQNAWQQALNNRQNWDTNVLNQQLGVAQGLMGQDASENQTGWGSGQQQASDDADRRNDARSNFNTTSSGMWSGTTPGVVNSQAGKYDARAAAESGAFNTGVETFKTMTEMAAGAGGGGGAGGAGGGGFNWSQFGQQAASSGAKEELDPWKR